MQAFKRLAVAFLCGASFCAHAQSPGSTFPSQNIKIVVPFTAGSGSDTGARFNGEQVAPLLKTSVIVENKPGASGVIAVQAVKSAPADGHTILLGSNSLVAVNPLVIKNLPYDPVRDLRPIAGGARGMNVLVASPNSAIRTLDDAVKASKTKPGGLSLATYSAGYQMVAHWFGSTTGLQFTNVPYKGGAQIMTDVSAGALDLGLIDSSGAIPLIQAGKLRPIVVTGEKRNPFIDAPTMVESGYKDFITYSWTAFFVRGDTPEAIVKILSDAFTKVNASPAADEFRKQFSSEGMLLDAAGMRNFQLQEIERFKKIAQDAGIKPE